MGEKELVKRDLFSYLAMKMGFFLLKSVFTRMHDCFYTYVKEKNETKFNLDVLRAYHN